jgi:hypothetical protein
MSQDSLLFVREGLRRIFSGLDSWRFARLVFDGDRHTSAVSLIAHKLHQLSSVSRLQRAHIIISAKGRQLRILLLQICVGLIEGNAIVCVPPAVNSLIRSVSLVWTADSC